MGHVYLGEVLTINDHDIKEVIQEVNGIERKFLELQGRFQLGESKNRNGRIYSSQLLEREIGKVSKDKIIGEGILLGELEHPTVKPNDPQGMSRVQRIAYERACIGITELRMSGNEVIGKCRILEDANECGRSVAAVVRAGGKPGISSRGFGSSPSADQRGNLVVAEDYNLVTFDIVSDPSTYGARLNAMLNEEYEMILNESKKHQKKLWSVLSDIKERYKN